VRVSERDPSTSLGMTGHVVAAPGTECLAPQGRRLRSLVLERRAGCGAGANRIISATAIRPRRRAIPASIPQGPSTPMKLLWGWAVRSWSHGRMFRHPERSRGISRDHPGSRNASVGSESWSNGNRRNRPGRDFVVGAVAFRERWTGTSSSRRQSPHPCDDPMHRHPVRLERPRLGRAPTRGIPRGRPSTTRTTRACTGRRGDTRRRQPSARRRRRPAAGRSDRWRWRAAPTGNPADRRSCSPGGRRTSPASRFGRACRPRRSGCSSPRQSSPATFRRVAGRTPRSSGATSMRLVVGQPHLCSCERPGFTGEASLCGTGSPGNPPPGPAVRQPAVPRQLAPEQVRNV
jgi:hypothetical protein